MDQAGRHFLTGMSRRPWAALPGHAGAGLSTAAQAGEASLRRCSSICPSRDAVEHMRRARFGRQLALCWGASADARLPPQAARGAVCTLLLSLLSVLSPSSGLAVGWYCAPSSRSDRNALTE